MALTHGPDERTNRPPDGKPSQQRTRSEGQEFEEEGTIHWKVASDAQANARIESTDSDPGVGSAGGDAEDGREKEGGVEGKPASDDIGSNTPEAGAYSEANKEGEGGEANVGR